MLLHPLVSLHLTDLQFVCAKSRCFAAAARLPGRVPPAARSCWPGLAAEQCPLPAAVVLSIQMWTTADHAGTAAQLSAGFPDLVLECQGRWLPSAVKLMDGVHDLCALRLSVAEGCSWAAAEPWSWHELLLLVAQRRSRALRERKRQQCCWTTAALADLCWDALQGWHSERCRFSDKSMHAREHCTVVKKL